MAKIVPKLDNFDRDEQIILDFGHNDQKRLGITSIPGDTDKAQYIVFQDRFIATFLFCIFFQVPMKAIGKVSENHKWVWGFFEGGSRNFWRKKNLVDFFYISFWWKNEFSGLYQKVFRNVKNLGLKNVQKILN